MKINHPYSCKQKPEINYPCDWLYKVIGENPEAVKEGVFQVLAGKDFIFTDSHTSSGGKYHSFNVELTVDNEEERLSIYNKMVNHAAIKVVI